MVTFLEVDELKDSTVRSTESEMQELIDSVFSTLVKAKIAFEKNVYLSENDQVTLRKAYFARVKRCKKHKALYKEYIEKKLKDATNKKITQFSYIAPYNSNIPPCTFEENTKLLKILLYYLEEV